MNSLLSKVIKRQKIELLQQFTSNYSPRIQLGKLESALTSPLVKVVTGPRRCGKSTLVRLALQKFNFAYLNFEDDGIPDGITGDEVLSALSSAYTDPEIYFFDEIQNMERWEQFIHRLHREGKNCVITGSNAHLLSSELATALTGRHISIELLPFSYQEIVQSGQQNSPETFDRYLSNGGFPDIALHASDSRSYLSTLWDSVVLKDVVRRYKVRNVSGLNDTYGLMLQGVSARFSFDSLAKALGNKVSAPSIKNFLRYAEEAYLLTGLEPYFDAPRKRIKSDRKSYAFDTGYITSKMISGSANYGRLLENLVFIELVRRGYRINLDLFYYVTAQGFEVDFLTRQLGKHSELIQVCWSLNDDKTRDRELRALANAAKQLGIEKCTAITHDEADLEIIEYKDCQISLVSAREWLMQGTAA